MFPMKIFNTNTNHILPFLLLFKMSVNSTFSAKSFVNENYQHLFRPFLDCFTGPKSIHVVYGQTFIGTVLRHHMV